MAPWVLATVGLWVSASAALAASSEQPIAFNHRLHVEDNGLECVECHSYVETQTFAGLPTVATCLECHEDPLTDSPEEEKIRQAAEKGEPLVWERLYRVPTHVYYSHRMHVAAAELSCSGCHGPIAETTSPPARALNQITMDFCMDCHRQKSVTVDCVACHK